MLTKNRFGRTDLQVTSLGFGGAPIGILDKEPEAAARLLNGILDEGINVIDTAACYRESETRIGDAVGARRDEFVLISKCGHQVDGVPEEEWSPALITQTVERALRRLRTDRLDVMLLHSCDLAVLRQGEAMDALIEARDLGKVRYIGYSGDNEAAAYAARLPDVDVIETSVNICDQMNLGDAVPAAKEREMGVIAKRPIANAAWKAAEEQPGFYKEYSEPYAERLRNMGLEPEELGFEGVPGEVWPEIALRFTLSQPGVHTAIIGTTNLDNARANIRAAARGPLPEPAVRRIREAFRRAAGNGNGGWKGLT